MTGAEKNMRDGKQRFADSAESDGRPYQNPLCKPVISAGKIKIGLSQAKLFGLMDDKCKDRSPSDGKAESRSVEDLDQI